MDRERDMEREGVCLNKSRKGHMLSPRTFSQVTRVSYRLNVKVTSRERRKHEFTKRASVK